MKKNQFLLAILFLTTSTMFGQKLKWVSFYWEGDTISGKYYDKAFIKIPVTIGTIPHKFDMQFDLGSVNTVFYGNSIEPYIDVYSELKDKIDTTLKFKMNDQVNPMFKGVNLKLANVDFGKRNIGYFKNFGDSISKDSINTKKAKSIGTIGTDLFKDKILIIDYPNKRICIIDNLPKKYQDASFRPFKFRDGQIFIPLIINDKEQDLMFDTGSSMFALFTSEKNAKQISDNKIVDSLETSTWGKHYMVYGETVKAKVKFGDKELQPATVYYDKIQIFDKWYNDGGFWGLTGNAYFTKNIIIIDNKKKLFGVK